MVVGCDELGIRLGLSVSIILGNGDGRLLVGIALGLSDAATVGFDVGSALGLLDAVTLGLALGRIVGTRVGRGVGVGGRQASRNVLVALSLPGPPKAKYSPTTKPITASIITR